MSDKKSWLIAAGAAAGVLAAVGYLSWRKNAVEIVHDKEPASASSLLSQSSKGGSIFTVTGRNGFLPLYKPLRKLPSEFSLLDAVMEHLPGLLSDPNPEAVAAVVATLPEYSIPDDMPSVLRQALMRDYSILVSAFIMEGKTKSGKPRTVVPRQLAVPFAAICKLVDEQMIMSYDSYCLSNVYSVEDVGPQSEPTAPVPASYPDSFVWENLRLIRAFDGGPEEATFILVHAEIEHHTGALVKSYDSIFKAMEGAVPGSHSAAAGGAGASSSSSSSSSALAGVRAGLQDMKAALDRVLVSQLKMFNSSNPRNYEKYVRPWIFGWKGNADFPEGVVFEGVNGDKPTFLRGETGAQSSIVPSADIVLGILHKADQLRVMLQELEAYRPLPQRQFLVQLRKLMFGADTGAGAGLATAAPGVETAQGHRLREFVRAAGDRQLVKLFNSVIGCIWCFRSIHVTFSDLYIARFTGKETATGGTPFKAYLRKHRDESIAHQITDMGEDLLFQPTAVPEPEDFEAEMQYVLQDSTENGIPPHLLKRHADIIRLYGMGSSSLQRKAFPRASDISNFAGQIASSAGRT